MRETLWGTDRIYLYVGSFNENLPGGEHSAGTSSRVLPDTTIRTSSDAGTGISSI
jgi:hypothetical protein